MGNDFLRGRRSETDGEKRSSFWAERSDNLSSGNRRSVSSRSATMGASFQQSKSAMDKHSEEKENVLESAGDTLARYAMKAGSEGSSQSEIKKEFLRLLDGNFDNPDDRNAIILYALCKLAMNM